MHECIVIFILILYFYGQYLYIPFLKAFVVEIGGLKKLWPMPLYCFVRNEIIRGRVATELFVFCDFVKFTLSFDLLSLYSFFMFLLFTYYEHFDTSTILHKQLMLNKYTY